jgi:cytochrome c biogenesis protein CcmG/thiol:disulfide interchange protein DsbE
VRFLVLLLVSVAIPAALLLAMRDDGPRSSVVRARGSGGLSIGAEAPDFTLTSRSGGAVRLSDLRPTPVVLTFFASWCGPCRREMPLLDAARREHAGDLEVLAVSWEDHVEGDVERFLDEVPVSFPTFRDPGGGVGDAYRVQGIPLTFFVDGAGVIRDRVYGITSAAVLDESLGRVLPG